MVHRLYLFYFGMARNQLGGFARVVGKKVLGDEERGSDPMNQQFLRNETTVK